MQVINSLAGSLITLLFQTCGHRYDSYTENHVVSNTQLNFVQELLNPEVVFSNIIAVPDEIGLGC